MASLCQGRIAIGIIAGVERWSLTMPRRMFAAFEIVGFVVASAVAIFAWRKDPGRVLRFVIRGIYVALVAMAMTGAVGIPLLFFRFGHARLAATVASSMAAIHHYLGHWFITVFVLFWPALFVASAARPSSLTRKLVMGGAAVLCLLLFLLVSFTGYALPSGMPRQLMHREGAHAIRFIVLHVIFTPALAAAVLTVIAWRHSRTNRGAA